MFGNTHQYDALRDSVKTFAQKLLALMHYRATEKNFYAQILAMFASQVNADESKSMYCMKNYCVNIQNDRLSIPDIYTTHIEHARSSKIMQQLEMKHNLPHILCIPISTATQSADVILLTAQHSTTFSIEQIHFCQIAAELIGIAALHADLPSQSLPTIPRPSQPVQQAQLLSHESYKLEMRVRKELTNLLDNLLHEPFLSTRLPTKESEILVEVMGYVSQSPQFFSIIVRPDSSSALHFRVRVNEGRIGEVISKKTPSLAMNIKPGGVDETHLYTAQSALTYPLFTSQGNLIGALNIENSQPDGINENTVNALKQSPYLKDFASILQQYPLNELDEDDVVSTIFDDAESQVFAIVDPDKLGSALWQLLRIAGQIMHENDVSGGILFLNTLTNSNSSQISEDLAPRVHVASSMGNYHIARKEWSLIGSIQTPTRNVFQSNRSMKFDSSCPEWQPIGDTEHPQLSELIAPLHSPEDKQIIGFIDLVSGVPEAFNDEDEQLLNRLADIIEHALLRANEIREMIIERKLLEFTKVVFEDVNGFFIQPEIDAANDRLSSQEQDDISLYYNILNIDTLRMKQNDVLLNILNFVTRETGGHAAQILLRHEEVLYIHSHTASPMPSGPRSWSIEKGITGAALQLDTPMNIPNVRAYQGVNHEYFEGFPGTKSEMAIAIKRGNIKLGILDIQSTQEYHFTEQHEKWLYDSSSLIGRVLTAYDTAMEIAIDESLSALSDIVDNKIMGFRDAEFDDLRNKRNELFQTLLKTSKLLSRSSRVRVLISVNAYTYDLETGKRNFSTIDMQNGVLVEIYSTDHALSEDIYQRKRYPFVAQFVKLFQLPKKHGKEIIHHKIIWTPKGEPSLKQFFSDDTVSARIYPIFEGAYVIGAMVFEWPQNDITTPDWFEISTIDTNEIAQQSAQMASDIITSGRLRQDELLTAKLRNFDFDILRRLTPNRNQLVQTILKNTSALTLITEGWSQMIFLTHFPGDTPLTHRRESIMTVDFLDDTGNLSTPPLQNDIYANHPIINSHVLKNVIARQESWISMDILQSAELDDLMQDFDSDSQVRLRETRSLICVPLVRPDLANTFDEESKPNVGAVQGSVQVYGILLVGSKQPNDLSDSDEHILTLYARTITTGLLNVSLMQEKAQAMQELRHDLDKVMTPLLQLFQDHSVVIAEQLPKIQALVELSNQMLQWIGTLANEKTSEFTFREVAVPLICKKMQEYIDSYTSVFGKTINNERVYPHVEWHVPSDLPPINGFNNTEVLILSALFKLIDNALKYSPDLHPQVSVDKQEDGFYFRVIDNGPAIPEDEQLLLFERGFQRNKPINSSSQVQGSGLGLYQVRRIALQLHGWADYQREADRNIFYFSIQQSLR